jgi:hypothetical protein
MPATFRAAEAILTLLQLVPIIVLSVSSFRMRDWFIAPFRQALLRERGAAESTPAQARTASAETYRRWSAQSGE